MDINLLNLLTQALPLYSEEDDLREEVPESDLLEMLPSQGGAEILMCVRRLFEACALLDQRLLADGKWAFVSFPASLFGHSLMQMLATPGQQIFESDFWRSTQSGSIEEQRTLLKQMENRRVRLHPTGSASAIRFVFVAWGLIRLGGKFLLHHREDRSRQDSKNYVLPGGRFKPGDLPLDLQIPGTLRQLHQPGSRRAIDALQRTLVRELNEELDLHVGEDCHATRRVILDPYRRVEGSENKHSFTEYVLALYDVSLTTEGEAHLLDRIAHSGDRLVWFSIEDWHARELMCCRSCELHQDGGSSLLEQTQQELFTRKIRYCWGRKCRLARNGSWFHLTLPHHRPHRLFYDRAPRFCNGKIRLH